MGLYDAYRRSPEATRKRLYMETMQKVIPKLGVKLLLDSDAEGVLPLLPLESFKNLIPQGTSQREGSQ
jgi:membrane protease subunit HflK